MRCVGRLVVLCALLTACAQASDSRVGGDAAVDAEIDAPDGCVVADELCNNADEDCDGRIDESFTQKGMMCSLGMGACRANGQFVCAASGAMTECNAMPSQPTAERCDHVDNDCDGMTDESLSTVAETCNNMDEDCDGHTDEGFNIGAACDGPDSDACAEGTIACNGPNATMCSDNTSSTVEACNGLDDDCRNGVDDTFPVGQSCSVGLGACARTGQLICNGAGNGTQCDAIAGAPTAELCGNSVDEDCNGADVTCPPNDFAAGAIDISAGGTFTADLTAAHDDNWAASTATLDCGNQGGRDVFYQFTLPAEEVVYFDTLGSNYDSVIRVFAGACTSIGATKACADDACSTTRSQGAVDLLAGTYCLVVDQFSSSTTAGATTLVFKRGGRTGIGISAASGTQTGTTAGKVNHTVAGCESNTTQPDVGYFFLTCPGQTYTVGANTCSGTAFDTVIYLRSGSAATGDVACSDDVTGCGNNFQSRFTSATVSGANLQWIIVDGFGTSGNGAYSLSYTIQ